MSMANVFKAKSHETLRAVSFYTVQPSVSYEIEIYKDVPENGSPTDGALGHTEGGFMQYRGYKTVKLSENIDLPMGTRYAAVVTINVPSGCYSRRICNCPERVVKLHIIAVNIYSVIFKLRNNIILGHIFCNGVKYAGAKAQR